MWDWLRANHDLVLLGLLFLIIVQLDFVSRGIHRIAKRPRGETDKLRDRLDDLEERIEDLEGEDR